MSLPNIESPFCKSVPHLYRAWDNTLLSTFKTCGYKHLLKGINGFQKAHGLHKMYFGILYHAALEHYELQKSTGIPHDDAVYSTVRHTIKIAAESEYDNDGDSVRTLECLLRAVVWYTEHFRNDPAQTLILRNGRPAVELSFTVELPIKTPDGEPYYYCGHIDRIATLANQLFIFDYKTTDGQLNSNYFDRYKISGQITGYLYGAQNTFDAPVLGAIIDGCQLAVNFCRFDRGQTMRTKGQLDEWLANTCTWIKYAERCAIEGDWPMNEESCNNFGKCEFRDDICSKDALVRKTFLSPPKFKERFWNPLEARGV